MQQATALYEALSCPKTLRVFSPDDGAEEHCQVGNLSLVHLVAFDWLDGVFGVVDGTENLPAVLSTARPPV